MSIVDSMYIIVSGLLDIDKQKIGVPGLGLGLITLALITICGLYQTFNMDWML